jgi:deazaflavin-dependent oxidoreductase (nitroreductase family)
VARTYRITPFLKLVNQFMRAALRLGIAPRHTFLLTVRGRKSGRLYSTPVTLVEEAGTRWLVAPYGEVGWVRNVRATGTVMLTRGRRSQTVAIVELKPQEGAPILRKYLELAAITRPYFDVRVDSPLEAFVAEAPRHPVFRIQEATSA